MRAANAIRSLNPRGFTYRAIPNRCLVRKYFVVIAALLLRCYWSVIVDNFFLVSQRNTASPKFLACLINIEN
jgi:hypothetical protein